MGLTLAQTGAVTGIVEAVPDMTLVRLNAALSTARLHDPLFGPISDIAQAEVTDRFVRDVVLEPLIRLADPQLSPPKRTVLTQSELGRVWKLMKRIAPKEALAASRAAFDTESDGACLFDGLCRSAAAALRTPEEGCVPPGGREATLTQLLDLAPILRAAQPVLAAWARNLNFDNMTAVRLAYRDATDVDDGAGPIFIEALMTYLDQPGQVLRLISAVMDRPSDRYLASSELAEIGERLLADVDAKLQTVKAFNPSRGAEGGAAAAAAVLTASLTIREFEQWLALDKTGPWTPTVVAQKKALATAAETHLRAIDAVVGQALPLQQERLAGSLAPRATPRIEGLPDAARVRKAEGLLAFLDETRSSAAHAGFGALRAKVVADTEFYLSAYVEDVVERLRNPEVTDHTPARAYLDVAADFAGLVTGPGAAQIVRRRAAA